MQQYRFPDGSLQCRAGDQIALRIDERTWKIFLVQDIVRFTRLLPLGTGQAASLIDEGFGLDSRQAAYDKEIFLLVESFDRSFSSMAEAESAAHSGSLGPTKPGIYLNARTLTKSASTLLTK